MTKHVTHEQLLNGEGYTVSIINEPVTAEPPQETATARAMRIWFKQNPPIENEPAGEARPVFKAND